MKILTLDNQAFDMSTLPEEVDDIRFAVFDNADPKNPDYHYVPLIFVEFFTTPALVLQIGNYKVKMPLDWQILIGDPEIGDLEAIPITTLGDRGFSAFQFNPRTSFSPTFLPVDIHDVYHECSWYAPKLKNGQFLAVPLSDEPNPPCVYFLKDVTRNSEVVDYSKAW